MILATFVLQQPALHGVTAEVTAAAQPTLVQYQIFGQIFSIP